MSNAKNINEVSVITSVDSGDYVMVSDISDDSLKRATVTNVGKTLLGTTDISSIGDGSVTGAISDLDSTKVDKAGDTMTGTLIVSNASDYSKVIIGSANNTKLGFLTIYYNNGYGADLYPLPLTANRTIRLPDASGTLALTSNLPQIVSLYSSTPTQSSITLSVPSGFTPLLLYISTTNSSATSGSRSVFTLPIGMYGYIPLNVGGTSEYIRLESTVSGSTYSLNFLGSSGSDTYIQQVKALGYYS